MFSDREFDREENKFVEQFWAMGPLRHQLPSEEGHSPHPIPDTRPSIRGPLSGTWGTVALIPCGQESCVSFAQDPPLI